MPQKTPTLLIKLKNDFPQFSFESDDDFKWSPVKNTIYYSHINTRTAGDLLHELAHAILGHHEYVQDIELLQIERDAWTYAREHLATQYTVDITDDHVEDALDSYRDWLHQRSLCPNCDSNGLHTKTGTYKCLACGCQWRANLAQFCELRRFKI